MRLQFQIFAKTYQRCPSCLFTWRKLPWAYELVTVDVADVPVPYALGPGLNPVTHRPDHVEVVEADDGDCVFEQERGRRDGEFPALFAVDLCDAGSDLVIEPRMFKTTIPDGAAVQLRQYGRAPPRWSESLGVA